MARKSFFGEDYGLKGTMTGTTSQPSSGTRKSFFGSDYMESDTIKRMEQRRMDREEEEKKRRMEEKERQEIERTQTAEKEKGFLDKATDFAKETFPKVAEKLDEYDDEQIRKHQDRKKNLTKHEEEFNEKWQKFGYESAKINDIMSRYNPTSIALSTVGKVFGPLQKEYIGGTYETKASIASAGKWFGNEIDSDVQRSFSEGQRLYQLETMEKRGVGQKEDPSVIDQVARATPNTVTSMTATAVGGLVTKSPYGAKVAGMATTGMLEGGAAYQEAIDNGATVEEAMEAARITGSVNAAIEAIVPGNILNQVKSIFAPLKKELSKEVAVSVLKVVKKGKVKKMLEFGGRQLKERTKSAFGEYVTESAQEVVSNLAANYSYDAGKTFDENAHESGVVGAALGFLLGGFGGSKIYKQQLTSEERLDKNDGDVTKKTEELQKELEEKEGGIEKEVDTEMKEENQKIKEVEKQIKEEEAEAGLTKEDIAQKIVASEKMLKHPEIQANERLKNRVESEVVRFKELIKTAKPAEVAIEKTKPATIKKAEVTAAEVAPKKVEVTAKAEAPITKTEVSPVKKTELPKVEQPTALEAPAKTEAPIKESITQAKAEAPVKVKGKDAPRFKNVDELLSEIDRSKNFYSGLEVTPDEMKQVSKLFENSDDKINNELRGAVYTPYGGGEDVVIGSVQGPMGRNYVVSELGKNGKPNGRMRIHRTRISEDSITRRINIGKKIEAPIVSETKPKKKPLVAKKAPKKTAVSKKSTAETNSHLDKLKKHIGDAFDIQNPVHDLWVSKGNLAFIKFKKHRAGEIAKLKQNPLVENAQEAGGDNVIAVTFKKPSEPKYQEMTESEEAAMEEVGNAPFTNVLGSQIPTDDAISIIKKYLPEVKIEVLNRIVKPDGGRAWGATLDGIIQIVNNPKRTTPYHEIVHSFIKGYLTVKEYQNLMGAVAEERGTSETTAQNEEWLADNFMLHLREKQMQAKDPAIKKVIRWLVEQAKALVGKQDKIQTFYSDIAAKKRPSKLKRLVKDVGVKGETKYQDNPDGVFNFRQLYREMYEAEYGEKPPTFPKFLDELTTEKEDTEFVGKIIKESRKIGKKTILSKHKKEASVRQLKSRIKSELKKTVVKKQSGRPIGKFGSAQKLLDRLREISKMKRVEAQDQIIENLEELGDAVPTAELAVENEMLNLMGGLEGNNDPVALNKILNTIKQIKQGGRLEGDLKKFNLETDFQRTREEFIKVNSGGKGLTTGIKTTGVIEKASFRKFFDTSISGFIGWKNILHILSNDKSAQGTSFIDKWGSVSEQTRNSKRGNRLAIEKTVAMAQEAWDYKNDGQVRKQFKADRKEIEIGTFKNSEGETAKIVMTKAQARKRWMEFQDPTLNETFEKGMYYTEEIKDAITNTLNEQDIKFAKLQLKFYKEAYASYNEVYREMYGVDLPFNEFYSPLSREDITRETSSGFGEFLQEMDSRRSIAPSSTKSRVGSLKRLRERNDTAVLDQHIAEMEHFRAWATKTREMDAVFGHPDVRSSIIENNGRIILRVIDGFRRDFTRGGVELADRIKGLDKVRSNFTRSVLALKPAIALKQMVSFIAMAEKIPSAHFAKGIGEFFLDPIGNTKLLYKDSESLKSRGKTMERDVRTTMQSDAYANYTKDPSFLNMLMLNVQLGDQGAIILGGFPYYKYQLKHGNGGKGMTHLEAILAFEEEFGSTQQSADLSEQSAWQRGGSFAKLFTWFNSSQNQYFRKEIFAFRDLAQGRGTKTQALKTLAIYHFILPMLFQLAVDRGKWEEDEDSLIPWIPREQKRAAIFGSLNGMFIISDGLEYVIRKGMGLQTWDMANPIFGLPKDAGKVVGLIADDDITTEDVLYALRGAGGFIGGITGSPIKQVFDVTTGIKDIAEGEVEAGVTEVLGWSPYLAKQYKKNGGVKKKFK